MKKIVKLVIIIIAILMIVSIFNLNLNHQELLNDIKLQSSAKSYTPGTIISPVHHFTELPDFWISGNINPEGWVSPIDSVYKMAQYGDVLQHDNQLINYTGQEKNMNTFQTLEFNKSVNVSYSGEKLFVNYSANVDDNTYLGNFDGNQTFFYDVNASNPNGWDVSEPSSTIVEVMNYSGHNKVVHLDDNINSAQCGINKTFTKIGASTGTYEFWLNIATNGYRQIKLENKDSTKIGYLVNSPDGTSNIQVYFSSTLYNLQYANGTNAYYQLNTWMRIKLEFDITTGFYMYIAFNNGSYEQLYRAGGNPLMGWQGGNPTGGIYGIGFYTSTASTIAEYFIDSVDYSGSVGYYEGRIMDAQHIIDIQYLNSSEFWESKPILIDFSEIDYSNEKVDYYSLIDNIVQYNQTINSNMTFYYQLSTNFTGNWSSFTNFSDFMEESLFVKVKLNIEVNKAESESILNSFTLFYNVSQYHTYKELESYYDVGNVEKGVYYGFGSVFKFSPDATTDSNLTLNLTLNQNDTWIDVGFNFRLDAHVYAHNEFTFEIAINEFKIYIVVYTAYTTSNSISIVYFERNGVFTSLDWDNVDFFSGNWYNYRITIERKSSTSVEIKRYVDTTLKQTHSQTITSTTSLERENITITNKEETPLVISDNQNSNFYILGLDENIDNEFYPYRNTDLDFTEYTERTSYLTLFKESKYLCNVIAFQQKFDKYFLGNLSGYDNEFSDTFLNIRLENNTNAHNVMFRTRIQEIGSSKYLQLTIELYIARSIFDVIQMLFTHTITIPKLQSEDLLLSFVIGLHKSNEYEDFKLGSSFELTNSTYIFEKDNQEFDLTRYSGLIGINLQVIDGMKFEINNTQYNVSGAIIQNGSIHLSSIRATEIYRYNDVNLDMYFSSEYILNSPEFFCDKLFINQYEEIGLLPPPEIRLPNLPPGIYLPLFVWYPKTIRSVPLSITIQPIVMYRYGEVIHQTTIQWEWYVWGAGTGWGLYYLGDIHHNIIPGNWGIFDFIRIGLNYLINSLLMALNFMLYLFIFSLMITTFGLYTMFISFLFSFVCYWIISILLLLFGLLLSGILLLLVNMGLIIAIVVSAIVWVFSGCSVNYFLILDVVYAGILNIILFMVSFMQYIFLYISYLGISLVLYFTLILFLGIKRIIPRTENVMEKKSNLEILWRILTAPLRWFWGGLIKLKDFLVNWG